MDVVYTWVNGSDMVWMRQMRRFRARELAAAAAAEDDEEKEKENEEDTGGFNPAENRESTTDRGRRGADGNGDDGLDTCDRSAALRLPLPLNRTASSG